MKKLLFLLILTPTLVSAQLRDSVNFKTSIYEVMYSEVFEEPLWVTYTVQ